MTIASEITKLNTNLTNSYTACQNKGATMPTNQNFDNLASTISAIPAGTTPTLASLTVTPSTTAQTLTPPSGTDGYNTVQVSAVTASIDADIVAGNIKSGVNILGVTGTLQAGGTTPTGTYTITANGTYDVTYYASADVNVAGGSEYPVTTFYTDDANVNIVQDELGLLDDVDTIKIINTNKKLMRYSYSIFPMFFHGNVYYSPDYLIDMNDTYYYERTGEYTITLHSYDFTGTTIIEIA